MKKWPSLASLSSRDGSPKTTPDKKELNDPRLEANVRDLTRVAERFRLMVKNVEKARQKLAQVANASDGLRDALATFSNEDGSRKPSSVESALLGADRHSTLARVARSCDAPYRELQRYAADIERALGSYFRDDMYRDYLARQKDMDKVNEKHAKSKNPHSLDFEVAVVATEVMRSADRLITYTRRLERTLVAFEHAAIAEDRATALAIAAARISHAIRAADAIKPALAKGGHFGKRGDNRNAALQRLMERRRSTNSAAAANGDGAGLAPRLPETVVLRESIKDLRSSGILNDAPSLVVPSKQEHPVPVVFPRRGGGASEELKVEPEYAEDDLESAPKTPPRRRKPRRRDEEDEKEEAHPSPEKILEEQMRSVLDDLSPRKTAALSASLERFGSETFDDDEDRDLGEVEQETIEKVDREVKGALDELSPKSSDALNKSLQRLLERKNSENSLAGLVASPEPSHEEAREEEAPSEQLSLKQLFARRSGVAVEEDAPPKKANKVEEAEEEPSKQMSLKELFAQRSAGAPPFKK